MGGSAGNALHDAAVRMDGIDRSYAPTVVVPVLPVVHTYLPPVCASVFPPPFAAYIAVVESPVGYGFGIGEAGLAVHVIGHQNRIDGLAHRDACGDS